MTDGLGSKAAAASIADIANAFNIQAGEWANLAGKIHSFIIIIRWPTTLLAGQPPELASSYLLNHTKKRS